MTTFIPPGDWGKMKKPPKGKAFVISRGLILFAFEQEPEIERESIEVVK